MQNRYLNNNLCNIENSEERDAFLLSRKAEIRLNPTCCMDTLCTSNKDILNEACDLYQKSGEKYKNCQQWRKAGECYENCSSIKLNLGESPMNFYKESLYCYQKGNSEAGVKNIFFKMNDYLEKKGEIYEVGKNYEEMGIRYENEGQNKEAKYYYEEAIKYYEKDERYEHLKINLQNKLAKMNI